MKQKAYAVLLVITLGLSNLVYSQSRIDSLKTLLKSAKDSSEVNILNQLCDEHSKLGDATTMLLTAKLAHYKANRMSYLRGDADALNHLSRAFNFIQDYDSSIFFANKAAEVSSQLKYKKGMAKAYNLIGNGYMMISQFEKSLQNHFKALKIREEIGEKVPIADSYNNIGMNYNWLNQNKKSIEYHLKALKILLDDGSDKYRLAIVYGNIGLNFNNLKEYDKGMEYNLKAVKLMEELGNIPALASAYSAVGMAYIDKHEFKKSLEYMFKAVKISEETGQKGLLGNIYMYIGSNYIDLKDYALSKTYLLKAERIAKETGNKELLRGTYNDLADLYGETKQYQKAFETLVLHNVLKDSLFTIESTKSITELEGKYNTTKKEKEILILSQEKEKKAAQDLADKKQRQIIYVSLSVFLLFALVLTYVMFNNYRQKQKVKTEAIEKEKVKAELSLLKNQISPHVMFNSLNSIYFQMDEDKENSKEMLLQFADLLRYQLYECNVEFTAIEKEIEYMNKFVGIQKLRKSDRCKISFGVAPEVKNFVVAPLLMIPLVENAFKYVTNDKNSENFISILLTKNGNKMEFTTENTMYVDENDADKKIHKGGIGLTNLKNRLNLIYPKKHELSISKENNIFKTKLVLYV